MLRRLLTILTFLLFFSCVQEINEQLIDHNINEIDVMMKEVYTPLGANFTKNFDEEGFNERGFLINLYNSSSFIKEKVNQEFIEDLYSPQTITNARILEESSFSEAQLKVLTPLINELLDNSDDYNSIRKLARDTNISSLSNFEYLEAYTFIQSVLHIADFMEYELPNLYKQLENGRIQGCSVSSRNVWAGAVIGFYGGAIRGAFVGGLHGAVIGGATGFVYGAASGAAADLLLSCFR